MKLSSKEYRNIVGEMFNRISPSYDRFNALASLGLHHFWRQALLPPIRGMRPKKALDIATGTADVPILLAKELPSLRCIEGIDISAEMLSKGKEKIIKERLNSCISLSRGDAMNLPFEDHSFDLVTCVFGIRNFPSIDDSLREMFRVLRPGGVLLVLEFVVPTSFILNPFYRFYMHRVLPTFGKMLTHSTAPFKYLHESIEVVPQKRAMLELFEAAHFRRTRYRTLAPGVVALYEGRK